MSRQGPRPHVWKVQGLVPHQQYNAWLKMRAQANYRGEIFALSFEEFQTAWLGYWDQRGRGIDNFCLTRMDPEGAWIWGNVECIARREHFFKQRLQRQQTKELIYGKKKLSR